MERGNSGYEHRLSNFLIFFVFNFVGLDEHAVVFLSIWVHVRHFVAIFVLILEVLGFEVFDEKLEHAFGAVVLDFLELVSAGVVVNGLSVDFEGILERKAIELFIHRDNLWKNQLNLTH